MAVVERVGIRARVRFRVWRAGVLVRDETIRNLIVNGWLNRLRSGYISDIDLTVRELAWGSSTTAVNATQTGLITEISRKAVTTKTAGATVGEVTVSTYIAPGEANVQLEEWGLFGGDVGSLTMVSRVLWSHLKTASESIQVDWIHTYEEGP